MSKKPNRKTHKHRWDTGIDDGCHNCGAFTKVCKTNWCGAIAYCDSKGKILDMDI